MALAHITDLTKQLAARVLSQYQALPKVMGVIAGITDAGQEIEDALWDIVLQFQVSTAVGVWLDRLGWIVGQARNGAADVDYRRFIAARIVANGSNGRIEDLLNAARAGWGAAVGSGWVLLEWAYVAVSIDIPPAIATPLETDATLQTMLKIMRGAKSGGVKLTLRYNPDLPANGHLFVFDNAASPGGATGLGFGDAASPLTAAGKLSGANDA